MLQLGYQREHWALTGCILMDFLARHMLREGPQSRGRKKGGRRCQLESVLAEKCVPTPGSDLKMIGQKKNPENWPYLSNLSPSL